MGNGSNKRWLDIIRDRILGPRNVRGSDGQDDCSGGAEVPAADGDNPEVRAIPEAQKPAEAPAPENVTYDPPPAPEPPPPQVLGQISDGTSMMYVQTAFWVANYVKARAQRGDFTEDQLIEQFGVNVRRCIDPDWKGH